MSGSQGTKGRFNALATAGELGSLSAAPGMPTPTDPPWNVRSMAHVVVFSPA
jgi:hypothetical protein